MTYRFVAYDIQKNLKQSFDDADITLMQIVYWIQVVANRMRFQTYSTEKTDFFTSTFSSITVLVDNKGRKYIDLPTQIMNLSDNQGVVYVTYNVETCCCNGPQFAQVYFQSTLVGSAKALYGDEYTKPAANNPYFYRIGDRVDGVKVNRLYFLGLECVSVKDVEIALLSTLDPSTVCDLDDDIPLPDELVHELIIEILSLGRFITMVPQENINQGEDESAPIQAPVPPSPDANQNSQQ